MNDLIEKENIEIKNMIYEIRGKQVMLDSDLAKLYHVETKRINEQLRIIWKNFLKGFLGSYQMKKVKIFWSKISTKKIWKLVVVEI